jgi:N6-adenosine-specific RNA methylase IME4
VRGELDENEIREPFLPSELVAIGEEVERVEGEEAKQRQGTRTDMVENCHDVDRFGKTRDKVAQRLGTSGKTYEKAKFVVNAAKANPERFGKFVEEMDETRKVDKVYVQVKGQLENDEKKKNPIVCPPGRFATIVCDPPLPIEKYRTEVNSDEPDFDYPRWPKAELETRLRALGQFIDEKAADQCVLFLWTILGLQRIVEDAVDQWGKWSRLPSCVWCKTSGFQPIGLPKFNYEYVIIARRGGAGFLETKDFPLCFHGASREHSRKPMEFYDRVRRVSPGPRLNMFSREDIEGFARHGNEVEKFDEANRKAAEEQACIEELLKEFKSREAVE